MLYILYIYTCSVILRNDIFYYQSHRYYAKKPLPNKIRVKRLNIVPYSDVITVFVT